MGRVISFAICIEFNIFYFYYRIPPSFFKTYAIKFHTHFSIL
jgi:hypothetical protein